MQESALAHMRGLLRMLPVPPGRDQDPPARAHELLRAVLACAVEVWRMSVRKSEEKEQIIPQGQKAVCGILPRAVGAGASCCLTISLHLRHLMSMQQVHVYTAIDSSQVPTAGAHPSAADQALYEAVAMALMGESAGSPDQAAGPANLALLHHVAGTQLRWHLERYAWWPSP